MALAAIISLIGESLDSVAADAKDIKNIVFSGNTAIAHLLLQIDPSYIRRKPYIPAVSDIPILQAGEHLAVFCSTEDAQNGVRAFIEKRDSVWKVINDIYLLMFVESGAVLIRKEPPN